MKTFVSFLLVIFLFSTYIYAEKPFGPWNTKLVKNEKKIYTKHSDKNNTISTLGWGVLRFIRFFQIYISPQDGPNCRYRPTCSQYALLSIKKYGALPGIIMGADRFLRCNPFGAWGIDTPEENYFFNSEKQRKK